LGHAPRQVLTDTLNDIVDIIVNGTPLKGGNAERLAYRNAYG
jgi:hypothetical protein